jgi:hypothetical protein
MPGGICFSTVCEMAVTCAIAALMFTLGWKKILTTDSPFNVCDSTCSMSLTVVLSVRS